MKLRGCERPILVGGAAAEFYSGSAISTGDFDICTPREDVLEEELQRLGFVRPSGPGKSTRGWIHPDLRLGFEVVAAVPMDGGFDRNTLALIENFDDGSFVVISVEDLIADRMGQYVSGTANDRLAQAQALFRFKPDCDRAYLLRRIDEETGGELGIDDLDR
jgi:hypothetical protein